MHASADQVKALLEENVAAFDVGNKQGGG